MVNLIWVSQIETNIFFLELLIFLFSFLIILNSLFVILSENPIYSILYLILVFLNSAALLLLFYIDFISIIILVIYVGAIAVLFLFVVMMMNIKIVLIQESMYRYLPLGLFICICFFLEIFFTLDFQLFNNVDLSLISNSDFIFINNWFNVLYKTDLISSIAECIYAYKWYYFIVCAVVLFLAMVGAIVLTKTTDLRAISRSQSISKQVFANYKNRINLFYKKN